MSKNPVNALPTRSAPSCPRCRSTDLVEVDEAIYLGARARDKHLVWSLEEPVAYAHCSACSLMLGLSEAQRQALADAARAQFNPQPR